ncbi:MAG TPA: nitrilase-related carbon-nitrogen hydrolase, partial [Stellaceae bacterium]|nr:nitrilase-related carbon-nitrogen hydrolase [Stellaceae bacterium]
MARLLKAAAAQMGPIARSETRRQVVDRMVAMLREANGKGVKLLVYPEMALTTFFPRWYMTDQAEIDTFFETEMPGPETRRLFEAAEALGVGFYLGYCE